MKPLHVLFASFCGVPLCMFQVLAQAPGMGTSGVASSFWKLLERRTNTVADGREAQRVPSLTAMSAHAVATQVARADSETTAKGGADWCPPCSGKEQARTTLLAMVARQSRNQAPCLCNEANKALYFEAVRDATEEEFRE